MVLGVGRQGSERGEQEAGMRDREHESSFGRRGAISDVLLRYRTLAARTRASIPCLAALTRTSSCICSPRREGSSSSSHSLRSCAGSHVGVR